jgi:hypothetical protein
MAGPVFPRRQFLIASGTAAGGVGIALRSRPAGAAKERTLTLYRLTTTYPDSGLPCGGCHACRACQLHAANKLFSSEVAAEAGRAHPNCDCAILETEVSYTTWVRLFGNPKKPHTSSRDLRRRGTPQI